MKAFVARPSLAPGLVAEIPAKAMPSRRPDTERLIRDLVLERGLAHAMPTAMPYIMPTARATRTAVPKPPAQPPTHQQLRATRTAVPKPPAQPPTHQQLLEAQVAKVKAWQRASDRHSFCWRSYVKSIGSRVFDPSFHDTVTLSEFLARTRDGSLDLGPLDMHAIVSQMSLQDMQMMNAMTSHIMNSLFMKGSGKGTSQDLVLEEPSDSDEPPAARRRLGTPPRKPRTRTPGILAEASAASSGVAAAAMPCASAAMSTSDSDTPSWCEVAAAVEDAGRECPP
jgi:hypothetical protein